MESTSSSFKTSDCLAGVELYAKTKLPLAWGMFDVSVYRSVRDGAEHLAISMGERDGKTALFLRIHSECFTGEVLGSLRCDCKIQLDSALESIAQEGQGILIYLRNHEGRGIGLGNKIRAYELQQKEGLDTVEANHALGFLSDLRSFSSAVEILKLLNIHQVRLNTNNPKKIQALQAAGIEVTEVLPSVSEPNPHNHHYLRTKFQTLGHHLEGIFGKRPA